MATQTLRETAIIFDAFASLLSLQNGWKGAAEHVNTLLVSNCCYFYPRLDCSFQLLFICELKWARIQ